MINKILIANRGEIACRIARTCRTLGIATVAVYSDVDRHSAHVADCDEAVYLGGNTPQESYLKADRIIEAAKKTGAQAIHPGYGFLSENADFSQACVNAGLIFIGAPASSIRAMGSKSAAKTLMERAQVPLVPGYHGTNQDAEFLRKQADQIGYPVLLKASAGGGGKGMRVVTQSTDFIAALDSCKREAIHSFGDDKVLVERYVSRPRHIEVQVFADQHGQCVYLFDRDCSVQRRHQKVMEEAPAPQVSDAMREAIGQAAVNAARAVQYEGAGTIEFIVQADEQGQAEHFFFMEMNTRLQVEHPVTEMITGQDLVAWQIKVAAGEHLPLQQSELRVNGHAIEVRVYAENPDNQFLPSIGHLSTLVMPAPIDGRLRIDTGVRAGDDISPYYDPMIAKMITWGPDRDSARSQMARALEHTHIVGVTTNVPFLYRLINCEAFSKPLLSTGLIEQNIDTLLPPLPHVDCVDLAALVADQLQREAVPPAHRVREANSPWQRTQGWLANGTQMRTLAFDMGGEMPESVVLQYEPLTLHVQGQAYPWSYHVDAQASTQQNETNQPTQPHPTFQTGQKLRIEIAGAQHELAVFAEASTPRLRHLFRTGQHRKFEYLDPLHITLDDHQSAGKLTAPMPGKVVSIQVQLGQRVAQHAPLLVIEAMKMEHTITAPFEGIVQAIHYEQGEQVAEGIELLTFVAVTVEPT
jgi:3-methylcrotonyl-CoA carboxylase alpha subunit